MNRTLSHREFLLKFLSNPRKAAEYLNSVAEDGDIQYLLKALRNVVDANGGFSKLSQKIHMSRTSLYNALSENGNPEIATLEAVLKVYGIRIGFFPGVKNHKQKAA